MTLVGPHTKPTDRSRLSDVINIMLLHTASNLHSTDYDVAIAPKFRIDDTRLDPSGYTYGIVVDYMIIYTDGPTRGVSGTALRSFTLKHFSQTLSLCLDRKSVV